MPIVSTEILGQGRFSDGIYLQVKFTDQHGVERVFSKRVPLSTNINALIATRVTKKNQQLIEEDLRRAVYTEAWDYQLQHATLTQLRDYVRKEYREVKPYSKNKQRLKISRRLIEWIENGRFTVAQLRNAFGMTTPQFTTFRNKLIALRDADDLLENAGGE